MIMINNDVRIIVMAVTGSAGGHVAGRIGQARGKPGGEKGGFFFRRKEMFWQLIELSNGIKQNSHQPFP